MCISSHGYNPNQDKFYINIDYNYGITDTKELLKVCVGCDDILDCKKKDLFLTLTNNNEKITTKQKL